jgi:hypothetical protein
MKSLYLLLGLLPFKLFAQQLDSCGLNNDARLNAHEAAYFTKRYEETRGGFNFSNKRIIFITGESGNVQGSKREYFDYVKKWKAEYGRDYIGGSDLLLFTEAQRVQTNGHDAVITYWTKFHPSTDRIIKRFNRKAARSHK